MRARLATAPRKCGKKLGRAVSTPKLTCMQVSFNVEKQLLLKLEAVEIKMEASDNFRTATFFHIYLL